MGGGFQGSGWELRGEGGGEGIAVTRETRGPERREVLAKGGRVWGVVGTLLFEIPRLWVYGPGFGVFGGWRPNFCHPGSSRRGDCGSVGVWTRGGIGGFESRVES